MLFAKGGGQLDPYYNNVAVLLHGNVNPFVDSSKNAFSVGNANVTLGTAKYGAGSMEFNGSSSSLSVADNNILTFSGDFTIETWFFCTNNITFNPILAKWNVGQQEYLLALNTSGVIEFHWAPYSTGGPAITSSTSAFSVNTWYHLAITRVGSTITMWLDGTSLGTRTNGTAGTNGTENLTIGAYTFGGNFYQGLLDDLRITNGVGRYTASFTPPTQEFPNG